MVSPGDTFQLHSVQPTSTVLPGAIIPIECFAVSPDLGLSPFTTTPVNVSFEVFRIWTTFPMPTYEFRTVTLTLQRTFGNRN